MIERKCDKMYGHSSSTCNGNLYGLENDEIRLRPLFEIALSHAYANESNEKFNFKNENSEHNLFAVRVLCIMSAWLERKRVEWRLK